MIKEYEENIIPPPVEFRDDCKLKTKNCQTNSNSKD